MHASIGNRISYHHRGINLLCLQVGMVAARTNSDTKSRKRGIQGKEYLFVRGQSQNLQWDETHEHTVATTMSQSSILNALTMKQRT